MRTSLARRPGIPDVEILGHPMDAAKGVERVEINGLSDQLGRTRFRSTTAALTFDDVLVKELRGTRGLATLRRMELDPFVAGYLYRVHLLMRAPEWTVEPGGLDAIDIDFAAFCTEVMAELRTPWRFVVGEAAQSVLWGFTVHETLYEQVEGDWIKIGRAHV